MNKKIDMTTKKVRKPRTPVPYIFYIDEAIFKKTINLHFGLTDTNAIGKQNDQNDQNDINKSNQDKQVETELPTIIDQYDNVEIIYNSAQTYIDNNLLLNDDSSTIVNLPEKKVLQFLDSKKNKIKLWPTMIDIVNDIILPFYTNKPCRYCHRNYNTIPLGCPIKYYPHALNNEIKKKQIETFFNKNNFLSKSTDYFETEQMFCRLSCIKSYIYDCLSKNPMSQKYSNALSYLPLMFKKINDIDGIPQNIPLSPPIEILESYCGHLSIDAYHKSIETVQYEVTINVKRPIMFSASTYIEELSIK